MERYDIITANLDFDILLNSDEEIAEINNKLVEINSKLEKYTSKADSFDYALSVASGILCGAIDSLYVGEINITQDDIDLSHEQVNRFIEKYAKERGIEGEFLKDFVKGLEEKFVVAQDNAFKGLDIGVGTKNHHLADLAHHPTPLGLVAAIGVQFFRVGTFVSQDGKWHFAPVDKNLSKVELINIWMPAIISGLSNWLVYLSEKQYEEEGSELPEYLKKLLNALASAPLAIELLRCADNWFGHLVSDMAGSKQTAGAGMGIPGMFLSLAYEIASLPGINNTEALEKLNALYVGKDTRYNLRKELPIYKAISKETVPVIINELIVRTFYFVRNLVREIKEKRDFRKIDFGKIIPFDNRTLDQMLMISSLTFSFADTADAAVRAALESGGNFVLFSGKFVSRYNVVGTGRAVLSVVKEVSNDNKEKQILTEKRILAESKSEKAIEIIEEYKLELEKLFNQYMEEYLEDFIVGSDLIEEGLRTGDADTVIKGNVIIQSRLGKKAQFTNQEEFDSLMESEIPLIL